MLNLTQLTDTVQNNCHISDAYHAGNYSMCTFLLKMREYYRWEKQIPLSQPLPKKELGEWLVERESNWHKITEQNADEIYLALNINDKTFDPFDSVTINKKLHKEGYVYSSGYGLFSKPHFFLGKLKEHKNSEDYTLAISSREYARDLTAPPAMLQGSTIFIRQESIRRFIWEKIEEWLCKKNQDVPLARAIALLGSKNNIEETLNIMVEQETKSMFYHEIGEIKAGKLLGTQWEEMLTTIARSKAEILARTVRDLLADCIYTIPTLLERDNDASIHFYFANFSGIRKILFPEAFDAYNDWNRSANKKSLEKTIQAGQNRWHDKAQEILSLYCNERTRLVSQLGKEIELLF